jgi:hypothetical protein
VFLLRARRNDRSSAVDPRSGIHAFTASGRAADEEVEVVSLTGERRNAATARGIDTTVTTKTR